MNTATKPDASEIVLHNGGGASLTGHDAILFMRAAVLASSLKLYAKTRILPTRGVTLTKMLAMATTFTGKKYRRTEIMTAHEDVLQWSREMRDAIPTTDNRKTAE